MLREIWIPPSRMGLHRTEVNSPAPERRYGYGVDSASRGAAVLMLRGGAALVPNGSGYCAGETASSWAKSQDLPVAKELPVLREH